MSEELKPCPYCGATPEERLDEVVWCPSCGLQGPEGDSEENAIAAWNALPRREDPKLFSHLHFFPGRLQFTREKPTKTGFYFWRHKVGDRYIKAMVLVDAERRIGATIGQEGYRDIDSADIGEWAGPIPEPEESHDGRS